MTRKQPRWQRRAEDRPREICAAALEVFAEKGFAAARLEEIARRAGVSKGTLYLYFEDKEQLFRAVIRDSIAPNVEAITSAVASADIPFAKVIPAFLAGFAQNIGKVPVGAVAKMVIGESRNFPELARVWHDEVASKAIGAMAALVAGAQERGEVRPGDPRLYAFTLMGPMILGALWSATLVPVGGEPVDLERLASQHAGAVLEGLLVRGAG
ncbi:MAG TPA: TetR/AcrR family transcriptional regulator [Sphingomicrobium sp.]|nr:TetR/AcrR family transcriptional regulator [Sphingomicrobium sp.]